MHWLNTVVSSDKSTTKYIFQTFDDNLIVEFSYINKNDGKDIICLPSQTMCNLGCKFCHTLEYIGKIKIRNLSENEMFFGVDYIIESENIKSNSRTLLISFMGCGEPLLNVGNICDFMSVLKNYIDGTSIPYIRFAIATSIPKYKWEEFFKLTHYINKNNLPVKIHLSLHYTMDIIRKDWMPNSLDIIPSLGAVDFYRKLTGNNVEIHYTLIEGINDSEQDAILLSSFLKDKSFNVKFLFFNEKESLNYHASNKDKIKIFRKYFDMYNIPFEYYIPPGLDIGASCGQFLLDYYTKEL